MPGHATAIRRRIPLAVATLVCVLLAAPFQRALAQEGLSVFVNDSPQAAEALSRADELAAIGNHDEAATVLDRLLVRQGDRLIVESAGRPAVSVRAAAHRSLLADGRLLEAYRALVGPRAAAMLDAGAAARVEREMLLSDAGFEAALTLAQQRLGEARFASAWLTIEQLGEHPARSGPGAARAARLLGQIAAYAGRGSDHADADPALTARIARTLEQWRRDAGIEPSGLPPAAPTPPRTPAATVFDPPLGDPAGASVLERPLATVAIGPDEDEQRDDARRGVAQSTAFAHAVVGDLVVVNDGRTVSAYNRVALEHAWSVEIETWSNTGFRSARSLAQSPGDLAIADGVVIALTAPRHRGNESDERAVLALDAATGEVLWRRTLWDIARTSPADDADRLGVNANAPAADRRRRARDFEGAALRGRPVVAEGIVVLTAVRQVFTERLLTVSLLGLDLATGELRWVTPLGSAGLERWSNSASPPHAPVATGGLIVQGSDLGLTIAVEAASGRVRWLRSSSPDERFRRRRVATPWESQRPVPIGDTVYLLEAAGDWLRGVDRWTGATNLEGPASVFGSPAYLVGAGDRLLAVGEEGLYLANTDTDRPEPDALRLLSFQDGAGPPLGRVVAGPDRVFVPLPSGVRALSPEDAAEPDAPTRLASLRFTGRALPAGEQILVADRRRLHVYSSWETARDALNARIDARPADPRPAITFAQLAVQAGRTDAIVPAVDRSIRAIESRPLDPATDDARAALFRAVLAMLSGPEGDERDTVADRAVRGELVARLTRIAGTPAERAASLLESADHLADTGSPGSAVERYQRVLADRRLADAPARPDAGPADTAGRRATASLATLVEREGAAIYAPFNAEGAAALAELLAAERPGSADAADLARRYPLADAAGAAWAAAAALRAAAGRHATAAHAWGRAAAHRDGSPAFPLPTQRVPTGAPPAAERDSPARTAEALTAAAAIRRWNAGRDHLLAALAESLAATGRLEDAASLADTIAERTAATPPTLSLDGRTLTPADAASHLAERAAAARRRPTLGRTLSQGATLDGWILADIPVGPRTAPPTDLAVMTSPGGEEIGVFAFASDGPTQLWSRPARGTPLAADADTLYLVAAPADAQRESDRLVIARDIRTGTERWRTPRFDAMFAADQPVTPDVALPMPNRGVRDLRELLFRFDRATLVIADGAGRVAGVDLADGATRFALPAVMPIVHDIDASAGVIAVVGGAPPEGTSLEASEQPQRRSPRHTFVEAATGRTLAERTPDATPIWTAVASDATVMVGSTRGIEAIDPHTGVALWRSVREDLADTLGGIALPTALVVRDDNQRLRIIDHASGTLLANPAEVGDVMSRGFQNAQLRDLKGRIAVTSRRGTALLDERGALLGLVEREPATPALAAAFAENAFAALDARGEPEPDTDRRRYRLDLRELPGARLADRAELALRDPPRALATADGWILVSTSGRTLCIRAAD